MLHIKIGYDFIDEPLNSRNAAAHLDNVMFRTLAAVHQRQAIGGAAEELGMSYRHVWGLLRNWEEQLGRPLIQWSRGKRAQLTPFGEKLLFAAQQTRARMLPQIQSLASEIESAFALAFDDNAHVLTTFASHDLALSRLKEYMASQARLHLDLQFRGSVECLEALAAGRCALAGFHVSEDRARGTLTQKTYKRLLKPGRHKLIEFVGRTQGLMVARGNPRKLAGVADLTRTGVRFVNRQAGSGTRLELEQALRGEGIDGGAIEGYEHVEHTHLAVAATIASGRADAGFGIAAAAAQYGLDFVPLVRERYYLACLKETLEHPALKKLLQVLGSRDWRGLLADLPGYDPSEAGRIISLTRAMPWYEFRSAKPAAAETPKQRAA